jgi:hypothetical protein
MTRARFVKTFSDLVTFVGVLTSKLGASGSTELSVEAHEDDTGGAQQETELWGHAPLLYQPLAGSEAMVIELGDERVVFATRDQRWLIEVGAGEVALRAIGADAAYVLLKPDGTCVIEAKQVEIAGTGGQLVALSNLVNDRLASMRSWLNSHTHPAPGGTTSPPTPPLTPQASVAASRTKAV